MSTKLITHSKLILIGKEKNTRVSTFDEIKNDVRFLDEIHYLYPFRKTTMCLTLLHMYL